MKLFSIRFLTVLIFFVLLINSQGQKTSTKAARKDAMKKKAHEAAMKEAQKNTATLKNRKETVSDKIHKTVKDHTKKV